METGYTIVVGSQDQLSVLCGVNDGNLRVIEDYLGAPVVTRGNELTVATTNADVCRKFQVLVERVLSRDADASSAPDMIRAFISAMSAEEGAPSTFDSYIEIPRATRRIYPKTVKQAELIANFQKHDVVFAIGPAGTGKTFIAVAEALKLVLSRQVRKVVLTRPVVEAGENLGFLPGDLAQKINPYLRPLYDSIENLLSVETIRKMEDSGLIEVAPLAYMRGRTLDHAVIILDEAQNTTREQMKMFLTRLGEGSKMIITGDPSQTDLPGRVESGLTHCARVLANVPEIGFVRLENRDVVRNPLVKKIVQAYEQAKD